MCSCDACTVLPDLCRAFRCPSKSCDSGKVYPTGDGGDSAEERSTKDWCCASCGYECAQDEIAGFLEAAEMFAEALESAAEDGVGDHIREAFLVVICFNEYTNLYVWGLQFAVPHSFSFLLFS